MTRKKNFRVHDLHPLPPVHIVPESSSKRDNRARLIRDICIAQNVVIADLHRQIRALEHQLAAAELRAEFAMIRIQELEQQQQQLLPWLHRAERAGLLPPRKTSFWQRLLHRRNNG